MTISTSSTIAKVGSGPLDWELGEIRYLLSIESILPWNGGLGTLKRVDKPIVVDSITNSLLITYLIRKGTLPPGTTTHTINPPRSITPAENADYIPARWLQMGFPYVRTS